MVRRTQPLGVLRRWLVVPVVALVAWPAPSWAAVVEEPVTGTRLPGLTIEPTLPDDAVYAAPTTKDRIGRIVAPVMINGQGPFRFVVDTGASRSAISPQLAAKLGLAPTSDAPLTVQGVTGNEAVPAVRVARLQAGDIVLENRLLPMIQPQVFADADGILGVEGFHDMRIVVDFTKDRIRITRARGFLGGDWSRIPVKLKFGGLMVADATIGTVHIKAVIDSGAERTLGNLALRTALKLDAAAQEKSTETQVFGATSATEAGNSIPSPVINLGKAEIRGIEVTFADLNVFRIWGLEDEPAILIGMDVLGRVRSLAFDYHRGELMLLP